MHLLTVSVACQAQLLLTLVVMQAMITNITKNVAKPSALFGYSQTIPGNQVNFATSTYWTLQLDSWPANFSLLAVDDIAADQSLQGDNFEVSYVLLSRQQQHLGGHWEGA